jgi:hypothetical protein
MRGEVRALRGLLGITLLPGRLLDLVTDSLAREALTARDVFFAVADLWFIACPAYLAGALAQSRSSARHRLVADPCHDRPAPLARRPSFKQAVGRRRDRSVPSCLVRRLHGRPSVKGREVGRGTYGMVGPLAALCEPVGEYGGPSACGSWAIEGSDGYRPRHLIARWWLANGHVFAPENEGG